MPIPKRYRCLRCAHNYMVEVLTPEEVGDMRAKHRPTYAISCPECGSVDKLEGWD